MTVEKIHILSDEKQLLEHIAPEDLPTIVGGKCSCQDRGGNCMASDAGPWNTEQGKQIIERVREEESQKKQEHEQQTGNSSAQK